MLKSLRAGLLALAVACLAPLAARASCPTAPTYTGLSGLDAASSTQTLQSVTSAGSSKQLSTPLMHGNDGTTTPKAFAVGPNCGFPIEDDAAGDLAAIRAAVANIVAPFAGTAVQTVTRPADTTAYANNDAWADSTSAPTSGGFTLANVCSASGKTSALTTLTIVSSNDPATGLQGEIWLFNSSVTAVNDNAAFALSDADSIKLVGKIPFSLETSQAGSGTNSIFVATGLDMHVTCSGSANLRFLVKVKNIYTPASAEALQVAVAFKGDN